MFLKADLKLMVNKTKGQMWNLNGSFEIYMSVLINASKISEFL